MAVTVSLNIDYCASYLASLFLLGSDMDSGSSYGVYVAGVVITTLILVGPYWMLRPRGSAQQREKLALPAYIFAGCFCLQWFTNWILMIVAVSMSNDFAPGNPTDNWFSKQVFYNSAWTPFNTSTDTCSSSQTLIGFIPALFYSNMFSIVFLQIKAKTKISD